jgi:hypothetical protein
MFFKRDVSKEDEGPTEEEAEEEDETAFALLLVVFDLAKSFDVDLSGVTSEPSDFELFSSDRDLKSSFMAFANFSPASVSWNCAGLIGIKD